MNRSTKSIIYYVCLLILFSCGVYLIINRVSDPDVTTLRFIMDQWRVYIVALLAITGMSIANS